MSEFYIDQSEFTNKTMEYKFDNLVDLEIITNDYEVIKTSKAFEIEIFGQCI